MQIIIAYTEALMALSIRSGKVEELARELSRRTGETMTEAIAEALDARLEGIGGSAERRRIELVSIAAECAASPDLDRREADRILGYDEAGVFGHGR
jgi:antitoxin VapB